MTVQEQIKELYGVYEIRVLRGGFADEPTMNEEVPHLLSVTSLTYSALDVVVRMLSVYDGCHGICRNSEMFETTVLRLLAFQGASR